MLTLITSAFQGLAAIPKIIEQLQTIAAQISYAARIHEMQTRIDQLEDALVKVSKASSLSEREDAIKAIARATNA